MKDLDEIVKELGIEDVLAVEASVLRIRMDSRRYGKSVTVIDGFDPAVDMDATAKMLKNRIGCGGTAREGTIELQGDHRKVAKSLLLEKGFKVE